MLISSSDMQMQMAVAICVFGKMKVSQKVSKKLAPQMAKK